MGLFGKLFDKKECAICGGEIGLLGNRKLDDGNLCKNCAAKLSPFFSERRHSTVEQIREQLAYREANREAVRAMHITRTLGTRTRVLIDENARKFMITDSKNPEEANPDVISFSDVTNCRLDVNEHRRELTTHDKDGHSVSYNPPRYEYDYNFYIIIDVNHPYFDEIKFKLNTSTVTIRTGGTGFGFSSGSGSGGGGLMGILNTASAILSSGVDPRAQSVDYREYEDMGNEIVAILTGARTPSCDQVNETAAPKTAVICPFCKAETIPNEKGCCEYCGGALQG